MTRYAVIMLAGRLRASDLQVALGLPPVCLPISPGCTLLEHWRRAFADTPGFVGGVVAVSDEEEAAAVRPLAVSGDDPPLDVVVDPAGWRGMAGILRDLRPKLPKADVVVGIEANALPPREFSAVLAPFENGVDAVVGADDSAEASGVYAFRDGILERVRPVGYCDLKEQFLPSLYEAGLDVRRVRTTCRVIRVRDRVHYLEAVGAMSRSRASESDVRNGASLGSLIQPGATVGEGAVVDRSVVLAGATIADHSVVSCSIIGPNMVVEAGKPLVGRILAE